MVKPTSSHNSAAVTAKTKTTTTSKRSFRNTFIFVFCFFISIMFILLTSFPRNTMSDDENSTLSSSEDDGNFIIPSHHHQQEDGGKSTTKEEKSSKSSPSSSSTPPRDYPRLFGEIPYRETPGKNLSIRYIPDKTDGFGKDFSNSQGTWVIAKRRDVWNWFNKKFPLSATTTTSRNDNLMMIGKENSTIMTMNDDYQTMTSWSCGIGLVNNQRSESSLSSFEVKLWKVIPPIVGRSSHPNQKKGTNSKNNNNTNTLGPGWTSIKDGPELRTLTAKSTYLASPCETKSKNLITKENAKRSAENEQRQRKILDTLRRHLDTVKKYWEQLEVKNSSIFKKYQEPYYSQVKHKLSFNNNTGAFHHNTASSPTTTTTFIIDHHHHPSENNNSNNTSSNTKTNKRSIDATKSGILVPPELLSNFDAFIKERNRKFFPVAGLPAAAKGVITKVDLQAKSVSHLELQGGCLDDIIALDGRAPSLAHAMSRRCVDPFKVARKELFFLGIGHSHTRYLLGMMCMLGNHDFCGNFMWILKAVYPVFSHMWWKRQPLLRKTPAIVNKYNIKSHHPHYQQHRLHNNGVHYRLFHSSAWYDPRVALIRALKNLIDPQKEEKFLSSQKENFVPPVPPNITVFYVPDFGMTKHSDLMKKWDDQLNEWIEFIKPMLALLPTHFVVSRGEWDFHFMSSELWAVTEQTTKLLSLIHHHFPKAVIFLQLPQRHLYHAIPQQAYRFRAVCASKPRVQLMKEANICAAYQALVKNIRSSSSSSSSKNQKNNNKNKGGRTSFGSDKSEIDTKTALKSSFLSKLVIFDSDVITRSYLGQIFVDYAGHHYSDVALEALATELRYIATNPEVQQLQSKRSWFHYLMKNGKAYCKKINVDLRTTKVPNNFWDNEKFIQTFSISATALMKQNSKLSSFANKTAGNNNNIKANNASATAASSYATQILYKLPVSSNFGYPAQNGTKEMMCTCHLEDEPEDLIIKNPMRKALCDSVNISPKWLVQMTKKEEETENAEQKKRLVVKMIDKEEEIWLQRKMATTTKSRKTYW